MKTLKDRYQQEIVPLMQKEFGIKNTLAVPRVQKVVVNMGIGNLAHDKGKQQKAIKIITSICGQKPQLMSAKKAVSEFRIREGNLIGLRVTLRGKRMYFFLEKLFRIVLPRIRDFQGIKLTAFDQQANYTLGLTEQIVFPEVDYDIIDQGRGLEISIVQNTSDRAQAQKLLELMGVPFEKKEEK